MSTEIKIRNINADTIARIDQLAREKGVSRNTYLKHYIETLSVTTLLKEQDDKYNSILNTVVSVLEENTKTLNKIESIILK